MTNPFLFLDKPQDTTPNPFAFLDKPKQEDPGVFSYLGNITKNSLAILSDPLATATNPMAAPITGLANLMFGNSPQDRMQLQQIRKNLYDARQTESDTYKLVKEDLKPKNFFSKIKDLSMGSPSDIISGLPQAIASTIGSPISALTGLQMGQEGAPISTPEQRAADVKSTAGIALSTIVGGVTSLALKGTMEKAAFGGVTAKVAGATLGEETNMGLNILAKGPKIGQLGRDLLKGGVEAAAAGATFGAVANANKEGQLGSIITGLMFAPIGMVGEVLGTKIKGGDSISEIQQKAGELFALRQLQYSPDKSLFDLSKSVEAIATSNTLKEAAEKATTLSPAIRTPEGKIYSTTDGSHASIIERLNEEKLINRDTKSYYSDVDGNNYGYIDNSGNFISRKEAGLDSHEIPELLKNNLKRMATGKKATIVTQSPEISTQDLTKLLPTGEPGTKIEPSTIENGKIIKVAARDETGKPIGLLTLSKTGEKSADVFTVFVDPNYRRQGIATKLYDAAENAGYKIRSGQSGLSPEGKAFVQDRLKTQLTTPIESFAKQTVKDYTDNLYDEFKSITEVPENNLGFDQNFDKYAQMRGINPEDASVLKNEFINRVHDEIKTSLPVEERSLYNKMLQDAEKVKTDIMDNGSDKLRSSAIQNNIYFEAKGAGVISLRDLVSNKEVGTFHSVSDAQTYLDNIGKPPDVVNLDGNGKIPPSASAPPKIPDNVGPLNPPPSGWLEKKYALWSTRLSFATANPTIFKGWDTLFKTNLHATVFNPVDVAAKLMDGKRSVWLKQLKIADDVLGKATKADREHVFNWMETRSIEEHEKFGGVGNKPLSPMEIALGKQLEFVDLTNMYRYKNAMRSVKEGSPDFAKTDAAMKQQFNITPREINALTLLGFAEKNQVTKISIGSAVHYARLLQNPELALTRADYAKKFNLSPAQLQTGALLDKYFNGLSDVAGISKDKVLFNYITHARLYENGSLPDAIAKYALDKPTEEFYAALNRTGELSEIERDPIRAALRYTNALFSTLYLNPAINAAKDALKVELAKLPAGSGLKVERDASRYLSDVSHFPAEGDKYADAALNHLAGNIGVNVEKGIARKWVNGMNEVFTVAAQGARPWAGIRDFYSNTSKYFIKWGAKDTSEMLRLGATADLDNLRQSGLIENYTQLGLNSAVDEAASALSNAGSRLRTTVDKTAHKAMQLSGQQMVNDMARAGAFLVTRNKVANMLVKLHGGTFGDMTKPETFQKAYHSVSLERYSPAVFQEFDRMVKVNKTEEAANYLGNQHIQETFGNYANANHPSGWNNNFGRLVGKFGQWSINHRDYVVSLASRGTRTQRLASLGRLAMTESAIAGAATLLGVNLSNFYSLPGMYFKGGPAGDLFYTAYNAMFGRGMEQESAIRKITQLLPYDQVNDKIKGSIVVPFSFALTDLVDGLTMASNGDVAGGLARIGGVRPMGDNYQPSQWEQTIGDIVGGR